MANTDTPAPGVLVNDEAPPPAQTQAKLAAPPPADPPPDKTRPNEKPAEPARRRWHITPDAVFGALVGVGLCALTAWITHIEFFELRTALTTGKLDLSGETVLLDGKPYTSPKGPLRVEFWTPSVHTQETPGVKDWEKLPNDDKLNAFGDALMDPKKPIVSGYRRYEVTGSGLGGRKAGTWWVATGDFKLVDFLRLYHETWHPGGDDIYMEIASASGGHSR